MRVVPPVADPEAELTRLRRPTGPWLHLLDAAPADARQLGWMLGQDGVVVRILRGHCGRSSYGFFDEVGAALQLPGEPAEDWDMLGPLLTDMGWLPGSGHVLVVTRAALLLAAEPLDELRGLVSAVREVARGRAEEGDPVPFHVVLQDDAAGLAALRERLGATGAKYDDLSGWDAEEPSTEAVVGRRSSFAAGEVRPDLVDVAAGRAASDVDGVVEVGRAWEEFRGGAGGAVRVYAPVLSEPRRAAQVAGIIARAVAELGAGCVVVPLPADTALRDARQSAIAAAVTPIWPVPDPSPAGPQPPAALAQPESGAPPAASPPAGPPVPDGVVEAAGQRSATVPPPAPSAPAGPRAVGVVERAGLSPATATPPGPPSPAPSTPASTSTPATPPTPASSPEPEGVRDAARGPVAVPPAPPGPPAPSAPAGPPTSAAAPEPRGGEAPGDVAGADFELVAANLEWAFDSGGEDPDGVDAALLRHAAGSGRTAGLFRTWVRDPDGGWVRVILGYVGPRSSIADVEAERTSVVDVLQRNGAARCCVEVLAAAEVGDVHRWLEERCHRLWPDRPAHPEPHPHRTDPLDQPHPRAAQPDRSGRRPDQPAPEALPADVRFTPGPAQDDPRIAELIDWAGTEAGVVGLVTAYAGDLLVVGVALDGDTDPARIPRRTDLRVEPFSPSRGLDLIHLRLTRSATRVWTRRSERAERAERADPARQQRPQPQALSRPAAPKVVALGPPPVRDTEEARGDERLGSGFTLVGIDRETEISKGAPDPDERDTRLIEWAVAEPTVTALLRGQATVDEETIPVYTIAVAGDTDLTAARRALAAAIASTGTARAAAEAFAPAGVIPTFHLDLAVGSLRLYMG